MSPNFLLRSLTRSTTTPIQAQIKGSIPKWIRGTLYRNGPGRFDYGDKSLNHLFDGHACVHKFVIENGQVTYSNNFLETKSYTKTLNENRLYPVFGTADLCSNVFNRLKTLFILSETGDNVNVNIMPYANQQLIALTETNFMGKVNPKNLKLIDTLNVNKYIDTASRTIAHPHIDLDGSWITMGWNTKGKRPHYEFIKFKSGEDVNETTNMCEKAHVIGRIPSSHDKALSYFHSFGVTQNFIVFIEQTLVFDFRKFLMCLINNKPGSEALINKKDFTTRIHVINKNTGKVLPQKFIVKEPIFVFHHINSYENKNEIICDISAYDPSSFNVLAFSRKDVFTERTLGTNLTFSKGRRIKIPLNLKNEVECQINDISSNLSFELPVVNYTTYNGMPYKYCYGTNLHKMPFSIVKLNVDSGDYLGMSYSECEKKFLPSEAIFVAHPNGKSEDDGVLLVQVLSENNDFLSILDAKDLKEIARAEIPEYVKSAFTFHGFFADKQNFPKLNV